MKYRVFVVIFLCAVASWTQWAWGDGNVNRWYTSVIGLPPYEDSVDIELQISSHEVQAFQPVIASITLKHLGDEPIRLYVREDGSPHGYGAVALIAKGDGEFEASAQDLNHSGPHCHEITLSSGESTSGNILIWRSGPPTGMSFPEVGTYRLKFAMQPDKNYAPVYSNEIAITVSPDKRANKVVLDELSSVVYDYYELDRELVIRDVGDEYIVGAEILKMIIRQQKPHLVDPERCPTDDKEAKLVKALSGLVDRYPDSCYSSYIARYLGLVHLKTFEHELSYREAKIRGETGMTPSWKSSTLRADPVYRKALRYLEMASKDDLWPRTTALYHIGHLQIMAQEWGKVNSCCEALRTKYQDSGGRQVADKLEAQAMKYKHKLQMAKERQDTQEVGSQSE